MSSGTLEHIRLARSQLREACRRGDADDFVRQLADLPEGVEALEVLRAGAQDGAFKAYKSFALLCAEHENPDLLAQIMEGIRKAGIAAEYSDLLYWPEEGVSIGATAGVTPLYAWAVRNSSPKLLASAIAMGELEPSSPESIRCFRMLANDLPPDAVSSRITWCSPHMHLLLRHCSRLKKSNLVDLQMLQTLIEHRAPLLCDAAITNPAATAILTSTWDGTDPEKGRIVSGLIDRYVAAGMFNPRMPGGCPGNPAAKVKTEMERFTPLGMAISTGHTSIFTHLLSVGADLRRTMTEQLLYGFDVDYALGDLDRKDLLAMELSDSQLEELLILAMEHWKDATPECVANARSYFMSCKLAKHKADGPDLPPAQPQSQPLARPASRRPAL